MSAIELSVDDGAATILLNSPVSLNAWNRELGVELLDAVRSVAADDAVRAVVVRVAGRAFSAGADLRDMAAQAAEAEDGASVDVQGMLRDRYHPIITGLRTMPKPVVAAVHGPAVGIGCSLALAADLVIAAESAYFLLAFV